MRDWRILILCNPGGKEKTRLASAPPTAEAGKKAKKRKEGRRQKEKKNPTYTSATQVLHINYCGSHNFNRTPPTLALGLPPLPPQ
jgi:hypothetical protein